MNDSIVPPDMQHRPVELARAPERVREWASRFREHVTDDDLKHFGPLGVYETIRSFATGERGAVASEVDLSLRDPSFVEVALELFRVIGRVYFRWEASGVENIPAEGPALLVGNHNGGIMPFDSFLAFSAIWDRFGGDRALYALGHDLLRMDPVGRRLTEKFGVLRAAPRAAEDALRAGHLVLVYPGSDLDSWRPWRDRNRIQLGGRKGFLRVAIREGVPVVPVVSVGTHEQLVVLSAGQRIARRLGLKRRLRSEAFPITMALPWGITSGFFPYLPLPAQTSLRFGAPIRWPALSPADADREEVLSSCYAQVESAMQAMLDELSAGRIPVLGQPKKLVGDLGELARSVRRGIRRNGQ